MDISLKQYRDRCYINSLLCEGSYNFYNTINNICLFPTILGSSILTCLNSSNVDTEKIKYINIIINGAITIILAITTQYKIHDRISMFKAYQSKFTKLNHHIEGLINNKNNNQISNEDISVIVNKYDMLVDELQFTYPAHIRKTIIKKYEKTSITLPNSLAIESSIVIIDS
jgi:hypothetical protein